MRSELVTPNCVVCQEPCSTQDQDTSFFECQKGGHPLYLITKSICWRSIKSEDPHVDNIKLLYVGEILLNGNVHKIVPGILINQIQELDTTNIS